MKKTIRVQKWGNGIALPIPKAFAEQLNLQPDTPVEIVIHGDRLVVKPLAEPVFSHDQLLAGVTEENRHNEVDAGAASGREAW